MDERDVFSVEEVDFLQEMFSISAGNAATAFSQLFGCRVELELPKMTMISVGKIWDTEYYDMRYMFCTITTMKILGDIIGNSFFILKDENVAPLLELMQKTIFKNSARSVTASELQAWHESMLEEIGNIFAGTYLGAITRFCGLNIINTVPVLKRDKLYTFMESFIRDNCHIEDSIIMNEVKFTVEKTPLEGLLLIILSKVVIERFKASLMEAKRLLGMK